MEVWALQQIQFELGIEKGKLRDQEATTDCHHNRHRQGLQTQEKKKKIQTDLNMVQTSSPEAGRGQREGQSSKYSR